MREAVQVPSSTFSPVVTGPTGAVPRNLVVCCDGTNNEFGVTNTNVVRLFQVLEQNPDTQRAFYDPGVGTLPEPYLRTKIGKKISRWAGLAVGAGLTQNVQEAYTFLMNAWRPGDRVFLFGFSRGAYTVRVLASMLHQVGLMDPAQVQLLPYALRLFNKIRGHEVKDRDTPQSYFRLCGQFRNTFSQPVPGRRTRFFPVHFVGVWDTVSSYGRVWNPSPFPFTHANPSVSIVRHAVALDERRWFFQQNLFGRAKLDATLSADRPEQDVVERWFPGVHSDVGGGYPESDGGLWRIPFAWMVNEARQAGLIVNIARLSEFCPENDRIEDLCVQPKHESLTTAWRPLQLFPKLVYDRKTQRSRPRIGLGYRRRTAGAVLHESVLRRIRVDPSYRPPNLPNDVIDRILELPEVRPGATVTVPAAT